MLLHFLEGLAIAAVLIGIVGFGGSAIHTEHKGRKKDL